MATTDGDLEPVFKNDLGHVARWNVVDRNHSDVDCPRI